MQHLVVRTTNWIGDCIMTVPALRELRRHQPHTRITLMVRPWVRQLFDNQNFADAILECDQPPGEWARLRGNAAAMRRCRFDAALILPNALASALQAVAAGIPERLGYAADARRLLLTRAVKKSRRLRGRHQCFHYLDLLHALQLSPVDYLADPAFMPDASLSVSEEMRRAARTTADRLGLPRHRILVGINPGAFYGSAKRWFPERFAQVADGLADSHNACILVLGSSAERAIAARVLSAMKHPAISLAGETGLEELVQLLACCDLVLANDSGPMHLAAALNVPVVAVFGSTDATATAPLSSKARVVREEVACSPCLLRECPLDLRCFDQVAVREVLDLARNQLDQFARESY